MDDIEATLSALCDLASLRPDITGAEYDPKRDAAWLTMRGHEVTVVRLPGETPRWRLLTVNADTILTVQPWPTLGAEAILLRAALLTCDAQKAPRRSCWHSWGHVTVTSEEPQ